MFEFGVVGTKGIAFGVTFVAAGVDIGLFGIEVYAAALGGEYIEEIDVVGNLSSEGQILGWVHAVKNLYC